MANVDDRGRTMAGQRDAGDRAYPNELKEAEEELIKQRPGRKAFRRDDLVGVGLSGGGIRSATFCLGIFQAFGNLGLLEKVDYVSSVSGGGYFASFYGRLFTRDEVKGLDHVKGILAPDETSPVDAGTNNWMRKTFRWLRENGRYLSPHGAGDLLLDLSVVLRNWLSLQVVMATFILTLFTTAVLLGLAIQQCATVELLGIGPAYRAIYSNLPGSTLVWSPYAVVALALFALLAIPLGWSYWLVASLRANRPGRRPEWLWAWGLPVLIIAALILSRFVWPSSSVATEWVVGLIAGLAMLFALRAWGLPVFIFIAALVLSLFVLPNPSVATEWVVCLIAGLAILFALIAIGACLPRASVTNSSHDAGRIKRLSSALKNVLTMAFGLSDDPKRINVFDGATNRLSSLLKNVLTVAFGLFAFALIDTLGKEHLRWIVPLLAPAPAIAPFIKWIAGFLVGPGKSAHISPPLGLLAGLAAAVIIIPALVVLDGLSHAIADNPATPPLAAVVVIMFLLTAIVGQMRGFLNTSTLAYLYGSRLVRAYLGASNPDRLGDGGVATSDVVPNDDITQESYWSPRNLKTYAKGAPLHLVNVTVNETYGGHSEVEQRDRRGLGMAIGPAGVSVGVEDHVIFNRAPKPAETGSQVPADAIYADVQVLPDNSRPDRAFRYTKSDYPGQRLALGSWTGISGAAASTGLGSRTSLGLSLLTGFFNVRLGYWWDSGVVAKPPHRKMSAHIGRLFGWFFPVQRQLLNEFLSRFPGTSEQYWYLSDGGHFENMGGYELIRRRLPLIVIIDAEADENYTLQGLAGLVQKARLDFGAEIEFLNTEDELDERFTQRSDGRTAVHPMRSLFGTLDQLGRGAWVREPVIDPATERWRVSLAPSNPERFSLAHAALAKITYARDQNGNAERGEMIVIKPTLTGDEPADVLHYHGDHPSFPHESTADQWFDEAQWESYRKLGEHIGTKLFESNDANGPFQTFSHP